MTLLSVSMVAAPLLASVVYVNDNATGANNGTSWTNAYSGSGGLATAINATGTGDEIWVAEGTYSPIALKNGVKIYGGFAGTETSKTASSPDTRVTIISGGGTGRAAESTNNDASAVLRGFYIESGSVALPDAGGGILMKTGSPTIVKCVFRNNASTFAGGAVANLDGGAPTFINCQFYDNNGGYGGGALLVRDGAPTFINCLFHHNTAGEGGAIVVTGGAPKFIHCTIAQNAASITRGGAFADSAGLAVVRNCILWQNTAVDASTNEVYNTSAGVTPVQYSDVKGGWPGTGNIGLDPKFMGMAARNYKLLPSSPCYNAGSDAVLTDPLFADVGDLDWDGNTSEPIPFDLAGTARVQGGHVDMGAYEIQVAQPEGE